MLRPFRIEATLAALLLFAGCSDDTNSSPTPPPDGSAEASGDTGSNIEDTGESPDTRDAGDTGDTATDTRDAGDTAADTAADTADASDTVDVGRVPGTVPLSNFIGCDSDDECPVGTGNCVTAVPFNRTANGSPSRVTIAELDPTWTRSGVCSRVCSDQADGCAELRLPGAPDAAYACQVVAVGAPPYALDGSGALPDPATLDPLEQTKGLPFAALCLAPFRATTGFGPDFCEPCSATNACEPGSACWLDAPFAAEPSTAGACLTACGGPAGGCPVGFDCATLDPSAGTVLGGAAEGTYCVPKAATCGACRDADGDGFGTGLCDGNNATPHDCDDLLATTWFDAADMDHSFPLICGETLDANCNGIGDLFEEQGTELFGATHCTTCNDACGGAVLNGDRICEGGAEAPRCGVRCSDDSAFVDCDGDPTTGCEVEITDPSRLFYADCVGDGIPQDIFRFDCGGAGSVTVDVGGVACAGVAETDIVVGATGLVFDCDDADGANAPDAVEVCDGQDNDCNAVADDTAILRGASLRCTAPGALGTCAAGGIWDCVDRAVGTGAAGETCVAAAATTEICDGLDNDCDGAVDDGASVGTSGTAGGVVAAFCTLPAGSTAVGICRSRAANICQAGAIVCQAALPEATDLPGDGVVDGADANCDGWEGDLSRSTFVSTLGAAGGDGTLARPFATFDQALALKQTSPLRNQIYITEGTFPVTNGFTLPEGDTGAVIIGGYGINPVSRAFTGPTGSTTLAFGTGTNTICAAGAAVCPSASTTDFETAITVRNPSGVLLKNLAIDVATPPLNFGHIVGLACYGGLTGCGGLKMQGLRFSLTGADGSDGVEAAAGSDGPPGVNGNYAIGTATIGSVGPNANPTTAGISACSVPGGNGGGAFRSPSSLDYGTNDGIAAYRFDALSAELETFTNAGTNYEGFFYNAPGLTPLFDGQAGANATRRALGGTFGLSTSAFGVRDGTAGQMGQSGVGGGGGGYRLFTLFSNIFEAAGGGAGGGGGCGGGAGGAGRAGGSVIGLYWDSLTAPIAADFDVSFSLQPGKGGAGGNGGNGGTGGTQSALKVNVTPGQAGGLGGPGGHGSGGGAGGSGGNGWAVNVARRDTVSFDGLMPFVSPEAVTHDRTPTGGAGNSLPRLYRYATVAGNDPLTKTPDPAAPSGADAIPGATVTRIGVLAPQSTGLKVSTCWIDKLGDATSCFGSCPTGFHADPANLNRCAPDRIACDAFIGELGEAPAISVQQWNGTSYGQCTTIGCVDPANIFAPYAGLPYGAFCFTPVANCNASGGFGTANYLSALRYTACELDGCYAPDRVVVANACVCGPNRHEEAGACVCDAGFRDEDGLCIEGCADPNAEILVNTCSCKPGFYDQAGTCVAGCADPNATLSGTTCSCSPGFHSEAGVCTSDIRVCYPYATSLGNPYLDDESRYNGLLGERRWTGADYGDCVAVGCIDPEGTLIDGNCIAPSIPCSNSAGSGVRFRSENSPSYRKCFLTECYPGRVPERTDYVPSGECGSVTGQACTEQWECGYAHTCDVAAGTCL